MRNIYYSIIGLAVILFASCNDALDKTPLDRLTPETYFKTEKELELFTNRFYYDIIPSAASIYSESSDLIIRAEVMSEVSGQRVIPASGGGWSFDALRKINFYLQHSHQCENENAKVKYDAIAKFFRASFYFEKVKRFGDVPWYDKVMESTDQDLYKPRDSRQFVIDKILEDLDSAIENLPQTKDTYRVSKWTALALKSRVCLFEGTFRKYHGIDGYKPLLEECVAASKKLIEESGYKLYAQGTEPYKDLFAVLNLSDRKDEIILARDYDAALGLTHNVQYYMNATSMGRPGLSKKMVNSYLMKDGTRFTDKPGYETMQFYDECQNRDPRLAQTIRTPGYKRLGGTSPIPPNLSFTASGYHLIKYTLGTEYDNASKSCNDMPVFRLGEVYLNYAEAKAELETLTQADLDLSINLLRSRVGMPKLVMDDANKNPDPYLTNEISGFKNVNGPNKGVILEIRRERGIELVMEGFRYYDIIRWKEGQCFVNDKLYTGMYFPGPGNYDLDKDGKNDVCLYIGSKPSGNIPLYLKIDGDIYLSEGNSGNIINHLNIKKGWVEDRDYLYPIPTEDRVLTGGNLAQNPGWEDGLSFEN